MPGQGNTVRALQWLNEQGFSRIVVIDATPQAQPYWAHLQAKGLVDEVRLEGQAPAAVALQRLSFRG